MPCHCCDKTSSQKSKSQLENLGNVASFSNDNVMEQAPQKISGKSWKWFRLFLWNTNFQKILVLQRGLFFFLLLKNMLHIQKRHENTLLGSLPCQTLITCTIASWRELPDISYSCKKLRNYSHWEKKNHLILNWKEEKATKEIIITCFSDRSWVK